MQIKTFRSLSMPSLDQRVNEFIKNPSIEIVDIQFKMPIFDCGAMILYKEKEA
ncbi:hypothetical protein [Lederbergia ruris]|uniref:hypothetical protein n=1 Tax=Lederbergia ruris TaxID=217495 RepID=UPI00399F1D44